MKTEATLFVVGLMILSTIVYVAHRMLLDSLLKGSKKNKNKKQNSKNRKRKGNSVQRDWIQERKEMQWRERDTPRLEREKSSATLKYILAMLGCLVLLILLHTLV